MRRKKGNFLDKQEEVKFEKNRIKAPKFVIHQHKARKLHYDFRLEWRNVLKSWAIPKQPPSKENVKRLAIEVEDHPLSFLNFEGIIPEGVYGAGSIKIWDKGDYILKEYNNNKIIFELFGKKLKGNYCLIKFKEEKNKKMWILFKLKG
jgi:DNA ligase D-like protein (predicted 3'-phosphoesterase)